MPKMITATNSAGRAVELFSMDHDVEKLQSAKEAHENRFEKLQGATEYNREDLTFINKQIGNEINTLCRESKQRRPLTLSDYAPLLNSNVLLQCHQEERETKLNILAQPKNYVGGLQYQPYIQLEELGQVINAFSDDKEALQQIKTVFPKLEKIDHTKLGKLKEIEDLLDKMISNFAKLPTPTTL